MLDYDINDVKNDIVNLQGQNSYDFQEIKRLDKLIKEYDKRVTQAINFNNQINKKIENDYNKIKKIILDENVTTTLDKKIDDKYNSNKSKIEEIQEKQVNNSNKILEVTNKVTDVISQLDTKANKDDLAKISSGTPIFVNSIDEMIDNTKNYVNLADGFIYIFNSGNFEKSNLKYQELGLSNNQVTLNNLSKSIQSNFILRDYAIRYETLEKNKYVYRSNDSLLVGSEDGFSYKKINVKDYDLVKVNYNVVGNKIPVSCVDENGKIIYESELVTNTSIIDTSKVDYIYINSYSTSIKNCVAIPYVMKKNNETNIYDYLELDYTPLTKTETDYYLQYDNSYSEKAYMYDVSKLEKVNIYGSFTEYRNTYTLFDEKMDIIEFQIGDEGIRHFDLDVRKAKYLLLATYNEKLSTLKVLPYGLNKIYIPKINLEEEYSAVVDQEFVIEYESVLDEYNKNEIYISAAMPIWSDGMNKSNVDRFRFTPLLTDVGNKEVRFYIRNVKNDETMLIKTININVVNKTSPTNTLKCICIGDSLTNLGFYIKELKNLLGNSITFYGKRTSEGVNHEGRPSWKASHYITTLNYSGMTNPFYNETTKTFDFNYYITKNPSYSDVNTICLWLGRNDKYIEDSSYIENMRKIITSINSYNSNIKIFLFGAVNKGNNCDKYSSYKQTVFETDKQLKSMISSFNNVIFVPINQCIDTENDFSKGTRTITNRSNLVEEYITDNVHMNMQGMFKISDCVYPIILSN